MRNTIIAVCGLVGATAALLSVSGCAMAADSGLLYDLENLRPGDRALVKLPIEFAVRDSNRLYVYGSRVDWVRMTTVQGDSLYLNSVGILPPRVRPTPEFREDQYASTYGGVPYVHKLMNAGSTATEAGRRYLSERRAIRDSLRDVYAKAAEHGADQGSLETALLAALRRADRHSIVDWQRGAAVIGNCMSLFWAGWPGPEEIQLDGEPGVVRPQIPSERTKLLYATELYELVGIEAGPCWHVIAYGGDYTFCGEDAVRKVREQLEQARAGRSVERAPLVPWVVDDILKNERR
jgi:hypothetical protein